MTKGYLSEIFLSFQGEGLHAGRRQLFLRLSGCHLRCRYCDTPGSLERSLRFQVYGRGGQCREASNPVGPSEVLGYALSVLDPVDRVDGVAVTGGEPLLQAEFLLELLADARWPRPRLLETSGTLPAKLAVVLPVVDVVSMDIKLPSNTGEPEFWAAHAESLAAASGKLYVKLVVDDRTALSDVERAVDLVRQEAPDTPLFLQPITGANGGLEVSADRLVEFFQASRGRLNDVRITAQLHKILGMQ